MRCSLALALALAGCTAPDDAPTPLAAAGRVLALDLSPQAAGKRAAGLGRLADVLPAESRRIAPMRATAGEVTADIDRSGDAIADGKRLVADDLARRPEWPDWAVPTRRQLGQDTAEGLDSLSAILVWRHRPLPEIDDQRHRTEPDDDRPEASLWQRLRRRLRL